MSRGAEVIELARAKGVGVDKTGGVQLPYLTPKQKKELLGGEIGTAFDMYTRLFAAFSGGDVFEIGEWRVRDLDAMLARDGTAKALEQAIGPLRGRCSARCAAIRPEDHSSGRGSAPEVKARACAGFVSRTPLC